MKKSTKPRFGTGVLCNSVSKVGRSTDCGGVFTSFITWAYPTAIRKWYLVLSIFDLPAGNTGITVSVAAGKTGTGKKTSLATVDIDSKGGEGGSVLNIPLFYRFEKSGDFTLVVNVTGSTKKELVPFRVIKKDWPVFSNKDLNVLRKNPSLPSSIRTDVNCAECGHTYHFEESVLPEKELLGGVVPFPDCGVLECESCGHDMHVQDIQGQIRDSIKNAISGFKGAN